MLPTPALVPVHPSSSSVYECLFFYNLTVRIYYQTWIFVSDGQKNHPMLLICTCKIVSEVKQLSIWMTIVFLKGIENTSSYPLSCHCD